MFSIRCRVGQGAFVLEDLAQIAAMIEHEQRVVAGALVVLGADPWESGKPHVPLNPRLRVHKRQGSSIGRAGV